MNCKRYLLLLVLIISVTNACSQSKYVLDGTVGSRHIIMMVEEEKNTDSNKVYLSAKYFYTTNRHDVLLEGNITTTGSYYFEKKCDDNPVDESFEIKKIAGNHWSGKWINDRKEELPVALKPIDTAQYAFKEVPELEFENKEERIYTKARLSGLNFNKDSVTQWGEYTLQWYKESLSETNLFRIKTGFNAVEIKKINTVLAKNQYGNIEKYLSCCNRGGDKGQYYYGLNLYFINKNLLSINAFVNYDCGAVYPDSGDDNITIDVKKGKEIKDLDDIFWFTKKRPLKEEDEKYFDYIQERAEAIIGILTKLYPKEMKKVEDNTNDSCDYSIVDHWFDLSWYFTSKGLYISATFPHGMRPCNNAEFPIIPYKMLLPYISKERAYLLPK